MACCRSSTTTVFGALLVVLLGDVVDNGGFPVVFLVVSDRFAISFSCRFDDDMMSVTPLPHTPLRPIDSCATSLLCEMTAVWLALQ